MTPEDQLLLRCCGKQRRCETQRASAFPPALQADGLDWHLFLTKARREGVAPLVYARLLAIVETRTTVPALVLEALSQDYYAAAARNTIIFTELGKVLDALHAAGQQVIVLKGAALAEIVYKNLALRPMADVDLLIQEQDFFTVDQALKQIGYDAAGQAGLDAHALPSDSLTALIYRCASENSPSFHIHWHLVNSTVPNGSLTRDMDLAGIWRNAIKTRIAGRETLVLAPHHLLLHLAEHALRVTHSLSKLSYFCDIKEAAEFYRDTLDWDLLIWECKRFNLDRMVSIPFHFAVKYLDADIPAAVVAGLRPKSYRLGERIFIHALSRNRRAPGLSYLLYLAHARGPAEKLAFLWGTLFPPRRVIAQHCGIPSARVGKVFYLRRISRVLFALVRS